jgi:hypothetical protein
MQVGRLEERTASRASGGTDRKCERAASWASGGLRCTDRALEEAHSGTRCKPWSRSDGPVFTEKPRGFPLLEWLIRTETAKVAAAFPSMRGSVFASCGGYGGANACQP